MSFQTPITIKEAVENIENNKFLLPAIQREFVWSHTKIEWLFDSIMRNYPISSFLFWQVEGETKKGYRFYKFINEYREYYKTHNDEISTDGINDFKAILDGQQRLTSIYIGLKGSYAYKTYRKKWEDTEYSLPTRHLYLNISNELKDEEDGRVYEFKFLKKDDTKEKIIYLNNKKWLHIMLIKRVFGSSADTILAQIRNAFTDDFENIKIKDDIFQFPTMRINSKIKKDVSVSDEFIEELLCTQKDDKYAFSILSLLYPNLDYKNNSFHKDHLHPVSIFTKDFIENLDIDDDKKNEYYQPCVYNGIYNLQMLDANENMSKNDLTLNEWVDKEIKNRDKKQFLETHLIPDVDLSIEKFCSFIDEREKILLKKLKSTLQ